ncbi:MAG: response regulator [SAR324 cluster bacterium]|nr:response regulator [SAR324 cluster bacterium]
MELKFLVVDDMEVNQILLQKILQPFAKVDIAENGQVCLDKYKESLTKGKPYDVIFLDILMPVMDGQEALKKIREHESALKMDTGQEVKVIMVTSLNDWRNALDSFKNGVAEFVTKPIDRLKIIELLGRLGIE